MSTRPARKVRVVVMIHKRKVRVVVRVRIMLIIETRTSSNELRGGLHSPYRCRLYLKRESNGWHASLSHRGTKFRAHSFACPDVFRANLKFDKGTLRCYSSRVQLVCCCCCPGSASTLLPLRFCALFPSPCGPPRPQQVCI